MHCVVTTLVDDQTTKRGDKTYRRGLMRNSFRIDGRVLHETVANLSKCDDEVIARKRICADDTRKKLVSKR